MKHFFNFRKAKLLLAALMLLVTGGVSPAWAQVTESFEEVTLVDADTWGQAGKFSNGWVCVGSTGTINNAGLHATSEDYPFYLYSSGNTGDKALGGIASSTNNYYLVIPTLISGDVTYYCKGTASTYGYLRFYKVTDNGDDTYTIGSQIGSVVSKNSSSGWVSGNVSIGEEETMIAIKLNRMAIDDITYTPYVESGVKKPKSLTITSITSESADFSWSKGDEADAAWQIVYSTDENFDKDAASPIDVNTTSYSFSGLEPNTTYYAAVRTYAGSGDGEQSAWVSTSFKTEKVATPATGFTDNFETDKGWDLINGTVPNKWVRGTGTNNGGSYSLYISNDGSTYPNSYGSSSLSYASKLLSFEAGDYTIYYDWKCNGESTYDFMRVGLAPAAVELTASTSYTNLGSGSSLPTGWTMWLDGGSLLSGSASWDTKSVDFTIESAGNYQLIFAWRNDYSGGSYPAAVDNVRIIGSSPVLELGGDVVGTTLAFGSVAETTNKTIRITNAGKVAMENITFAETADEDNVFAYTSLPKTTLAANEYMDVTATFSGSSLKDYTGTFRVSADDCDPIDVTVTATYSNTPATMAVTLGEEAVGASVAFGNVGKQAVKTFTVTNDGDQTLNITSITSSNTTDFTVSPASLDVAGHSSETFTVTFVWDGEAMNAEKSATITVTASNAGVDPKAFTVTGTRIDQWSEDFSGGSLPEGWENDNTTYWTFTSGVAQSTYNYTAYYLTTPSLIVEEGESLSFDACLTVSESYRYLTVQKQKNNGSWESCMSISYSEFGNTADNWKTFTIEGLSEGKYKFRFQASGHKLDNFEGFKRNLNDPKMGVYTDVDCTVAAAASVTKDFGFVTENATQIYYIKNDGTGTLTLDQDEVPAGFSAVLGKTSLAKDESTTLTITFGEISGGYRSGNIVVNGSDGSSFTVAVSGVMVDNSKLNLNFATDNIPSTWTANDWMKDGGGYLKTGQYGYSNTSMETSTLVAEAGEQLVIVAKNGSSSNTYTFGVKYKQVGAAEWSDLIPAANIGTSWTTLRATIAVPGNYVLQFNGYYASIQRIYGLSEPLEPVMAVYDDEVLVGASYDFGNVSDEADATWTLTVKNEGKAKLTGLVAALSGDDDDHYTVTITGATGAGSDEIEADAQATITVTQLKDNLGSHSATLTISADDPIEDKVITLSGYTRDHTKLFADFESGMPSGWTVSGWNRSSANGNYFAQAAYSGSNTLTLPILTVAANEELSFDLSKQYNSSTPLTIRYTTNGGVDWTETDLSSYLTYGNFTTRTLSLGNTDAAVTALIQFVGSYYARLDNFYGGSVTTAPVLALTESAVAVESGSTKAFGNLTEDGVATYTLTNNGTADMVSVVSTTGVATAVISGEGEGVTLAKVNDSETYNKVTLATGKSATITLTVPVGAPYGSKAGAMTIDSEGWVGDMVVNYTATTIDPTALYEDFSGNAKPAGWYQEASGWLFSDGTAHVYTGVLKAIVTEQYAAEVASNKNVLSFDAKLYSAYAEGELKVYTSSDRKTWTLKKTVALTEDIQAVSLDALADGNYYVKFESSNASIDNLAGLKRILPAPAHDLYVTATTFPATALVPSTVAGVNATATVASLRADETGVYAKLFFDEEVVATAEPKVIDLNSTATFTLTGNVPATEKTYAAKIIVYYSDESVAWETGTVDVEVAHTRTLSITEFTREGEGEIDANASNQFSAAFNVTVQNTGSTAATPVVKIFIGETEVGTATADAAVAAGGSKTIAVNVTDASAGEGGELEFTAKAYWTAEGAALATSASNVTITVNATAPKFALYQDATPVNDGDDVDFGLVKGTTETFSYTIKNEGSADLVLKSIVAPAGFTATEVTEVNKTIAPAGTLAMDVTLNAEQGKVSGNLVITYRVDAMTDNTFTLALSGRSVAADTWTEDFESGSIPANWTNDNGWTVGETDGNHYATRTGWDPYSIMTPRLAAAKDEELTFDVLSVGNTFSYAYSTDKVNWSDEVVIDATGEQTFTAPAAGNYYLRFTTRNGRLDNLVGFRLNPLNLTLNESSSNSFIAANYDNVTLNRAFIAGWNTVCLPFAIDDIDAFFGTGAYAYAFDNYTDGNITFAKQDAMDAATPYLVFVPEAIASKELKNLAISDAAAGSVGVENTFTGTYAPIAAGGLTNKFVLTPQARIQKAGSGATMNAFRAYFTIPSGEVKALVFDDGTATSVLKIDINGNEDVRDIFDLAGRKLNETRKGINIVNGKKVLVK